MSIKGQSTLACCVLTTGRGSLAALAVEKKPSILSLSDDELGDAAAVKGGVDGGGVDGGGGAASDVVVVAGPPNMLLLPPLQPATATTSASTATCGARSNSDFNQNRTIPRSSLTTRSPRIAKDRTAMNATPRSL
jgi:hypothetical protein